MDEQSDQQETKEVRNGRERDGITTSTQTKERRRKNIQDAYVTVAKRLAHVIDDENLKNNCTIIREKFVFEEIADETIPSKSIHSNVTCLSIAPQNIAYINASEEMCKYEHASPPAEATNRTENKLLEALENLLDIGHPTDTAEFEDDG
ncbi:hypothetical protein FQA39_LY04403 [Lamprigera yunnana]|nr:hypothetical protein FQA39_LY04403 [Lamprigera yunnana]